MGKVLIDGEIHEIDVVDAKDNGINIKSRVSKLKKTKNENEVSLTLIGGRIGRLWWGYGRWGSEGSPSQVNIDPAKVLDREEAKGDIVGFWHTHPHTEGQPSYRDYLTMRGWWISFGKPIVCCIHGTDGLHAHWFFDDDSEHVSGSVKRFGNLFVGVVPKNG